MSAPLDQMLTFIREDILRSHKDTREALSSISDKMDGISSTLAEHVKEDNTHISSINARLTAIEVTMRTRDEEGQRSSGLLVAWISIVVAAAAGVIAWFK